MKDAIPFYRVVCAIIRHPSNPEYILVAQRKENDSTAPHLWEFPGGKIEIGEAESDALSREIWEELQLKIEVGERLNPSIWDYDQFSIELIPFFCETESTEMKVLDHQRVEWTAIDQLKSYQWAPADIPIVNEVFALLAHTSE